MAKALRHVVVGAVCAAGVVSASGTPGSANGVLGTLEVAESVGGPPAASPPSTADSLRDLTPAERSNAQLSLEGVEALGEVERQQALQVEELWAEGRYDEAIGVLSQLEAGGVRLAVVIAWRQPVASAPKSRGADARIGAPRVGATDVALDFDQETGNLFAVVKWTQGSAGWTVNISTDGGDSWSVTFGLTPTMLVDAAVVDQFLYVAYTTPSFPGEAHIRRFFVTDGMPDASYGGDGFVVVANVSPNTILDVAVASNADAGDNRIYCAIIDSNHEVRYFWDEVDDEDFEEESPAGTSAESGLDLSWGGGTMGSPFPNSLWLSYLGTDGGVHVLGKFMVFMWNYYSMYPTLYGNETRTRISAYGNNVVVAYTAQGTNATAPGYHVSYNNGASWFYGFAYDPPAGAPGCYGVDVTARGGWGTGIVYNSGGAFDTVSMVAREDYAQGSPWNPPQTFNEIDAFSGAPSFIQYLWPLGAYGMVYLAGDTWDESIPYFDLIALMPFDDGFDFGDTSAWSDVVP